MSVKAGDKTIYYTQHNTGKAEIMSAHVTAIPLTVSIESESLVTSVQQKLQVNCGYINLIQ